MNPSQNASLSEIAAMAGIAPNNLHPDDIPATVQVRTGRAGRPQHAVPLDDLAEFALLYTENLSEAECRLNLAIRIARAQRRTGRKVAFFRTGTQDPITGMSDVHNVYDQPRIEDSQP